RWAATKGKLDQLAAAETFSESARMDGVRLSHWLRRPEAQISSLPEAIRLKYPEEIWSLLETNIKYEGYIRRQESEVQRARAGENRLIPTDLNFNLVADLRTEARQKLASIRPATYGQASRISGITPADLAVLEIWLRRERAQGSTE